MSIAAISSSVPAISQAEVAPIAKPATVAPVSAPAPASTPAATVSISAAAHQSASVGDVDHDGDSR